MKYREQNFNIPTYNWHLYHVTMVLPPAVHTSPPPQLIMCFVNTFTHSNQISHNKMNIGMLLCKVLHKLIMTTTW